MHDTARLIRPSVGRLLGTAEDSIATTVAAGQVIVLVTAALEHLVAEDRPLADLGAEAAAAAFLERPVTHSEIAAPIGVGGSTAVRALGTAVVAEGKLLLVDAAAGGVGTFLTQLARNRGARVVGTASPRNHEHLAVFGATPIDYTGDWEQAAIDAEIAAAQDLSAAGHVRGKLLLEIVPQ